MRDRIANAVEEYIDKNRDRLKEHVDTNLEKLKIIIIDELPDKIMDFIEKRIDDGDDEHDTFLENVFKVVTSLTGNLSDDFKDDVREDVRRNLDDATVDSADKITDIIVTKSKKVVWDLAIDDVDDDDEDDVKNFFKQADFGILRDGKEGIINKVMELVKPPVHHSGDEIDEKISNELPGSLMNKAGGSVFGSKREVQEVHSRGIFSNKDEGGKKFSSKVFKFFGDKKDEVVKERKVKFLDKKIFSKLPAKVSEIIRPLIAHFEESLLRNIEEELRENIFKDERFKKGVKKVLIKFGGDSDGDGENILTGAVGAMSNFFKKK